DPIETLRGSHTGGPGVHYLPEASGSERQLTHRIVSPTWRSSALFTIACRSRHSLLPQAASASSCSQRSAATSWRRHLRRSPSLLRSWDNGDRASLLFHPCLPLLAEHCCPAEFTLRSSRCCIRQRAGWRLRREANSK